MVWAVFVPEAEPVGAEPGWQPTHRSTQGHLQRFQATPKSAVAEQPAGETSATAVSDSRRSSVDVHRIFQRVCDERLIPLERIHYSRIFSWKVQIKGPDNPTCVALCVRKTRVEEKEGEKRRRRFVACRLHKVKGDKRRV